MASQRPSQRPLSQNLSGLLDRTWEFQIRAVIRSDIAARNRKLLVVIAPLDCDAALRYLASVSERFLGCEVVITNAAITELVRFRS